MPHSKKSKVEVIPLSNPNPEGNTPMKPILPTSISLGTSPGSSTPSTTSSTAPVSTGTATGPVVQPSLASTSATTSSSPTVSTPTTVVDMPPDVTIPTPPPGFTPPNLLAYRGLRPNKEQLTAAQSMINDLATFADYDTVLGTAAPPAAEVAHALLVGLGWRVMRGPSETWTDYVRAEDAIAWGAALTLIDQVKPLFLAAMTNNPQLATKYKGMAAMFRANQQRGKTAANTKKRKAKAKATAAATAATEAAKAAAPAVAGTPKAVTVNA